MLHLNKRKEKEILNNDLVVLPSHDTKTMSITSQLLAILLCWLKELLPD